MSSNRPLQPLNSVHMNAKANNLPTNSLKTPIKSSVTKPTSESKPHTAKKKKEKLSALCKTPPSVVRTRNGRGYHRGLFLGEGGFARCFQMKDESGKVFAAKTVAKASIKNEKTKTKLLSEIKIHKSMVHSNIVQFIDCFEDDVNVYILLEICPHQSLMELLKTRKILTEPEVRYFTVQIIGAVKYLHGRRVIHRDLKLGNVFFDPEMDLKIGDFGLASVLSPNNNKRYTICGTPNYIAPEVLGGKNTGHSFEVDVWAIGIMIYALLFGKPPFQARDVQIIYERIKNNEFKFPSDSTVSQEAIQLVKDILSTDPHQRPSLDDILNYDWFRSGPFPSNITVETLRQPPKNFAYISMEESLINFANLKQRSGINEPQKNPVQILRTDLESEQPKTLLPHSLSPGNTKNKYKEVAPVTIKPLKHKINAAAAAAAATNAETTKNTPTTTTTTSAAANNNHHLNTVMSNVLNSTIIEVLEGIKAIEQDVSNGTITSCSIWRPIMVSKWVDYSNKHGFSYELSSNVVGVLFNNGQTIMKCVENNDVFHVDTDLKEGWKLSQYHPDHVPAHLYKELDMVEFFSKYMSANLSNVSNANERFLKQSKNVFLRRYTRDDNCIMFELSDGSLQFNFKDHHKICISDKGRSITHISPNKNIETLPLSLVLQRGNFIDEKDEYFMVKFDFIKHALKNKLSSC
ncbi:hypothetical protein B5S32_g2421 [[Candida] boidinii]|nr:hypothetical protein B5S32_g2421 [[Candida] boidinii]